MNLMRKYILLFTPLVLTAAGIGLAVSCLVVCNPAFVGRLDNLIHDAWLETGAEAPAAPRVAVVDIDEASIRRMGQVPWPRTILSELVTILLEQGVSAIGLDIWFTEPDRSSPVAVDSQLEKDFGLNLDFSKLPLEVLDNDRYFRKTIENKPVVLGALAVFGGKPDFPPRMPGPVRVLLQPDADAANSIAEMSGLVSPVPILANAAPVGLLNVRVEEDGIVRSVPLLARAGKDFYPSLALRTMMAAEKETELTVSRAGAALRLKFGNNEVFFDRDGSFTPVYYGPARTLPCFSAIDVLDGKTGRKDLEGKIVFIGSSPHSLSNERSTPLDPAVPDAEIHATVAENILSGQGIRAAENEKALQIAVIFFSAFAGVLLFRFFTLPAYVSIFLVLAGVAFFTSWICFEDGIFFSPLGSLASFALAGICILPFRYWREQTDKKTLRDAFSRYVAPEVVSRIVAGGGELLRGRQKEATIMFTDLRGFTGISESLKPDQLVRLLNSYFTPMTACITARQGTVDKFIGDAIMAFWNAPLDVEKHETQAVQAALSMQKELAGLRPALKNEFGVEILMGIGINSGLVQVGNMGSNDLLDYTCIGENVNLASRLEGMCKYYGVGIVVSQSVRQASHDEIPFLLLDKIMVKGSHKPLKIYTPLNYGEVPEQTAAAWHEALAAYFAGDFAAAQKLFALLAGNSFLAGACDLFIRRCITLEENPAEGWAGVWSYREK